MTLNDLKRELELVTLERDLLLGRQLVERLSISDAKEIIRRGNITKKVLAHFGKFISSEEWKFWSKKN